MGPGLQFVVHDRPEPSEERRFATEIVAIEFVPTASALPASSPAP